MRTAGRWCVGAWLLLFLAVPALAHRGHSSLSVVEIQLEGGAVTVTHYFAAHDVEPALKQIAPDAQPSLDDEDAVKELTAYVSARFSLADEAGQATLQLKDVKLAGDDVRIIYTAQLTAPRTQLHVRSSLFSDVYGDQQNQVNVRRGGITRTLNFTDGADAQSLPAMPAD